MDQPFKKQLNMNMNMSFFKGRIDFVLGVFSDKLFMTNLCDGT